MCCFDFGESPVDPRRWRGREEDREGQSGPESRPRELALSQRLQVQNGSRGQDEEAADLSLGLPHALGCVPLCRISRLELTP